MRSEGETSSSSAARNSLLLFSVMIDEEFVRSCAACCVNVDEDGIGDCSWDLLTDRKDREVEIVRLEIAA